MRPKDPLDQEAPWVSKDGSVTVPSHQVAAEMQDIGADLALMQLSKSMNNKAIYIIQYYITTFL